jgi:PleD family two-component response regulator
VSMQTAVKMHASVLVVDDEARQLAALCDTLEDTGYKATGFTSARHALAALRESEFDLLLTDLTLIGEMLSVRLSTIYHCACFIENGVHIAHILFGRKGNGGADYDD